MVMETSVRIAGLAACVALLLASCSSTTEPTSSSLGHRTTATATSAAKPAALKTIDPKAFQAVVEAAADKLNVPGTMVLLRTPQGNFDVAVGTTELGTKTPPAADTHFRIASNTKTMTAALIVLLAQDGKLKFSDPVSAYVPDVPNGENITIAKLLKMRSGLYGYTADPDLSAAMDADLGKVWTPQDVLAIAFRHPPQFAPDASYEYSNTNYALLGLIAEKVGGRPLAQQFGDRLFGPVGLRQTSLPAADDTTIPAPFSHGYMYGGSYFALADDPYPADMQAAAKAGTLKPIDYTNQNSSYATAAGGAISTADDLATWMKALVSGKVFDADYQQAVVDQPAGRGPCGTRRTEVRIRSVISTLRPERRHVLPRWRTSRLQLVHGLRPGQRCDTGHLDESDALARRQDHGAGHACPGARRDLRRVESGAPADSDHHQVARRLSRPS